MTVNPKHIQQQKEGKAPFEYIPWGAMSEVAHVMKGGADKYGVRNWLKDKILASTYIGAIVRHLIQWAMGANKDKDSGRHPLAHIIACCLIVMDSEQQGTLIDDRLVTESKIA